MFPTTVKSLHEISSELLLAVKNGADTVSKRNELAKTSQDRLQEELPGDNQKKAFWINIYNAYYQVLKKEFDLKQPKIFTDRAINLGGRMWSLDDIEHGILRKYRYKYSLGYFPQLFAGKSIKSNSVNKIDFRIHFALNCGAISCPPIAFYDPDRLEDQLDKATRSFMENETQIDDQQKSVFVSRILFWFLGDFGGKKGIRKLVKKVLNKDISGYRIRFNQYSWEEHLDNFVE